MSKVANTIKWIIHNFFLVATAVFVLIYVRWFQLTPLVPPDRVDYNSDYIAGLILLIVLIFSTILWRYAVSRSWRILLLMVTTILLFLNLLVVYVYMPRVDDTARYHGTTYYAIDRYPMFDDWHSYSELTKWRGFLNYERIVLGRPQFAKQIIYDGTMDRVVIIVRDSYEMLVYIDGEPSQYYDTGIQIDDRLYYAAYECIPDPLSPYLCKSYRWRVYQCELDDSGCKPLPFEYEGDAFNESVEKNETTNEINIYFDIGPYPGTRTLIFTWGEHPRCYVEGCKIVEK